MLQDFKNLSLGAKTRFCESCQKHVAYAGYARHRRTKVCRIATLRLEISQKQAELANLLNT